MNKHLQMNVDLIKGLASVDGNITFNSIGYSDNRVILYGTYWGEEESKAVKFSIEEEYVEMLEKANSVQDVLEVYDTIGYFKNF